MTGLEEVLEDFLLKKGKDIIINALHSFVLL